MSFGILNFKHFYVFVEMMIALNIDLIKVVDRGNDLDKVIISKGFP